MTCLEQKNRILVLSMGVQAGETPAPPGLLKDAERLKQDPQLQEHIKAF